MDLILMGSRDARRLGLIQAALQGSISNREGAESLKISVRQFKRLRSRVRREGARAVVHGNRGRPSPRLLEDAIRRKVVEHLTGKVKLNDHHIADLLEEQNVTVSASTVRRLRCELRLAPKQRRRPPQHRRRRERAARRGALVLIDGSPFSWFADEAPPCSLIGAIDDASGEILALNFRPTEDLHGYILLLRDLALSHGLPLAFYGDRSGILIRNDAYWSLEEELAGRQTPPQFGQMIEELGIRFIAATSPQAKGRIERLWRTLQDRLAAELRLAGHTTVEAAHEWLPSFIRRHNQRRGRAAADPVSAFRDAPRQIDRVLACRYSRVVARDNTVTIPGRWAQVPPGPRNRSWHAARVEVRELLDGRLQVFHPHHGLIAEQPAPAGAFELASRETPRARRQRAKTDPLRSPYSPDREPPRLQTHTRKRGIGTLTHIRRPASDHPWKRNYPPRNAGRKASAGG